MTCEIIQADFAETLRRVADMGGCDMILMSPPYADARTYGAGVSTIRQCAPGLSAGLNWTMADYQRLGDVVDAPVREWRKGYGTERGFLPWQVMLDWAERVGLRVPDRLCYGRLGPIGRWQGRFRNDWEPLLWFQEPSGAGFFEADAIAGRAQRPRSNNLGTIRTGDALVSQLRQGNGEIRLPGTLWYYGNVGHNMDDGEDTDHPARFFTGLAEDAARCFCPPGGLVVDPFSGSGTTAAAAGKHGRRFFGGDLLCRPSDGKPWAEIGYERWRAATAQQGLAL